MAEDGSAVGIKASDPQAGTYLAVWLFFQIVADHVFLPVLVATFLFAKGVKRNPTLINMCITWIIAGVSSSLLFYVGKQTGAEPSHALCILQAAMLEGTPPMTSLSALALIYTVWTSLGRKSSGRDVSAINYWIYALLIIPYVTLFAFALATSMMAIQDLRKVNRARRFFYCSVDNNSLSNTMAIFSSIICFICVVFEILIAIRIARIWRAFKNFSIETQTRMRGFDKQLVIRLFVFSGYLIVGLFFNAASVRSLRSAIPDIFAASIGMGVFFIFGTQPDVLRAWAFWLPTRPPPPPPKDLNNLDGSLYRFSSFQTPVAREHTTTILSEAETLHDAIHTAQNFHGSQTQTNTPDLATHSIPTAETRLMMSRKGDSVIIIGKPEEVFECLGRGKHNSV